MSQVLFSSTNRVVSGLTFAQALLLGQAPDKGLFMPDTVPGLSRDELLSLVGAPYPQVAFAVLRRYLGPIWSDDELQTLCEEAYDFPVPLERVDRRRYVLRLDQGPTASFKDFAARMMGRLMGRLVAAEGGAPLTILTATSGDTGSAVANAFYGLEGIRCLVLFPKDEVSDRQRKQMTTLGGNVSTIAVDGKFDDCQALVKRAFADPELAHMRLSSANSINIGRLVPQSVYYLYAWLRLANVEAMEPIVFAVPSGNFGDLCGGLLAQRAGLPVRRFVVATNANEEVPLFFRSGEYHKIEPSRVCISNAMNVGHPSNLARLVHLYGGHLDEAGRMHQAPDMDAIRRDMWSIAIDDNETRDTISDTWARLRVMLEPHGAVGWAGLQRFFQRGLVPEDALAVSLETAHPAKFPDEVVALTGVAPELPPSLSHIDERPESFQRMGVDYADFARRLRLLHSS